MFDISEKGTMVFSWAENENGEMVHVDDVLNGKACNCHCPSCGEALEARHGEKYSHGFAHLSHERKANLAICYQVVLYKVAEQLIQKHRKITLPSYYNIFPEKEITFVDVKINSDYQREDKQPDIIATTEDNQQYIIELFFDNKATGHAKEINYEQTNCIEINLTGQTLYSIKRFITGTPDDNWKWVNNNLYFKNVVEHYKKNNLIVELVDENVCAKCEIRDLCDNKCCCEKNKDTNQIVKIKNGGKSYKICKVEQKEEQLAKMKSVRTNRIESSTKDNDFNNSSLIKNEMPEIENCCQCINEIQKYRKNGKIFCGKYYRYFTQYNVITDCENFSLKTK